MESGRREEMSEIERTQGSKVRYFHVDHPLTILDMISIHLFFFQIRELKLGGLM